MQRPYVTALVGLGLLSAATAARADPLAVTHSGYLLDEADRPVTRAQLPVTFKIYNTRLPGDSAEQLVWSSSGCKVDVTSGFYVTTLGESCSGSAPLDTAALPFNAPRYLEITVDGVTLSPRLALRAVPLAAQAMKSADAQALIPRVDALEAVLGAVDDDTKYTAAAGGGLALDGTTFALANDPASLQKVSGGKLSITAQGALAGNGAALTNVDALTLGGKSLADILATPNITGNLVVGGSARIGNDGAECVPDKAGTVRWTGSALQVCNGTAWRLLDGAPAPTVASIAPTAFPATGGTQVTVRGAGFQPGAAVFINGEIALDVQFTDATTLTAKTRRTDDAGTREVRVLNPDGKNATLPAGATITAGVSAVNPTRVPIGGGTSLTISGAGFQAGAAVTVGGVPATEVQVLNGSVILAKAPAIGTAGAKTIAVTNPNSPAATLDNALTYFVPVSLSLTTCGLTGRVGPSQAQCNGAYGSAVVTLVNGIQRWTVPATGTYAITAWGAQGATNSSNNLQGGLGAGLKGEFDLTQGDVLAILVGQQGIGTTNNYNVNGGGGGTFIARLDNTALLVAGGGGAAPSQTYGTGCARGIGDGDALFATGGRSAFCNALGVTALGGQNGQGGTMAGRSYNGAAGGGFLTNGQNGTASGGCGIIGGGFAFVNGGLGGQYSGCHGSGGNSGEGGFGGGGAGDLGGPGGGGGYSGGGAIGEWSSYSVHGGGGGSYNVGSNQAFAGTNTGNGRVSIVQVR